MPSTIFKTLPVAALLGLALTVRVTSAATTETLASQTLEIELNTGPFSYRVTGRSSGELLVSQTGAMTFTDNRYTVRSVTDVVKTKDGLCAVLHLEGTSEPAQTSFTWIRPDIVQVRLTFKNGVPADIREEFADQGGHYYGIWEAPFGGNIDNRGADHDFLGICHQADENC
jgi:hypothetical protein